MMRKKAKYGSKVKKAQTGNNNFVKKNRQTGQPTPKMLNEPSSSIDTKNLRKKGAQRTTAKVENPSKLGKTNPTKTKLKASLKNAAFNSAKRRAIYNQLGWAQDSTSKKLGSKPTAAKASVTKFGKTKTATPKTKISTGTKTKISTGTKIKNLALTSPKKRTPSVSSGKSTAKPTNKAVRQNKRATNKAVRQNKRATNKAARQNKRAVRKTVRKVKRNLK